MSEGMLHPILYAAADDDVDDDDDDDDVDDDVDMNITHC